MNEVVPGLWVSGYGEWTDAVYDEDKWLVVCVLENCEQEGFKRYEPIPHTKHYPLLRGEQMDNGYYATRFPASKQALDQVASEIAMGLREGRNVLVHCGAGVERSPLAIAWYLSKSMGINVDAAYDIIRRVRPNVFDRQSWLPWEEPVLAK
jgi:protein-tyrosine phosphatase